MPAMGCPLTEARRARANQRGCPAVLQCSVLPGSRAAPTLKRSGSVGSSNEAYARILSVSATVSLAYLVFRLATGTP